MPSQAPFNMLKTFTFVSRTSFVLYYDVFEVGERTVQLSDFHEQLPSLPALQAPPRDGASFRLEDRKSMNTCQHGHSVMLGLSDAIGSRFLCPPQEPFNGTF